MNLKILKLRLLEKLSIILKKDPMKYRVERFRLNGAKIGENVRAFSDIISNEPYLISIGDNCTIASGCKFITHDNSAIKIYDDATDFVGEISIGNNCFIGLNSIFLPGVKIADNCIVGAGSCVTKSFADKGIIIAGSPAKAVGKVEDLKQKRFENRFNFKGLSAQEKKQLILNNKNLWLNK